MCGGPGVCIAWCFGEKKEGQSGCHLGIPWGGEGLQVGRGLVGGHGEFVIYSTRSGIPLMFGVFHH